MPVQAGENLKLPYVRVRHADLLSQGDGPFRRWCPTCARGLLLVARDQSTMELVRLDHCTLCGQGVIYTDNDLQGTPFAACAPVLLNPCPHCDRFAEVHLKGGRSGWTSTCRCDRDDLTTLDRIMNETSPGWDD